MDDGIDKELTDAMTDAFKIDKPRTQPLRPPPPLPPVKQNSESLTEQWEMMEKIRWELRQRIMTGRLNLEDEFRRRRHEIEHQHQKALLDSQIDLEAKRDQALKELAEEIRERLREFESLKERLDS